MLIKKITQTKYITNLLIIIFFAIITYIFLLNSPLHIWNGADSATDSSVFKTIALMMNKGHIPYLESFDHKGPYTYIINWIGLNIAYYRGVWIIEFVNLFITICTLYKIARLKCNKIFAIITSIVAISMLFVYFQGGNLIEEYAMPLIAISLYIFLDYLINKNINKKRLIICGICLGVILLLRPNMIATWVLFCIVIFIKIMKEKKYNDLKKFTIYFLIGMGISIIPILIWLGLNGALSEFWKCYIQFNRTYSSSGQANFENQWSCFFYFLNNNIIILSSVLIIYMYKTTRQKIYIYYLLYMILNLVFICLSGREYNHYGMVLVPVVVFPISTIYRNKKSNDIAELLITVYLLITILPNWISLIQTIPTIYKNKNQEKISSTVKTISQIIDEKTEENEKISVYGNWDIIYVMSKREHATKYSYQFPIGEVEPIIMQEYMQELKEELPSLIVVSTGKYDNNINEFLESNNYILIWQEKENLTDSALLYELKKVQ